MSKAHPQHMDKSRPEQGELGFQGDARQDGYQAWVNERDTAAKAIARQIGLPLNHMVEVWLKDGTCLKGRLLLQKGEKDRELLVGRVRFSAREIESCVRTD